MDIISILVNDFEIPGIIPEEKKSITNRSSGIGFKLFQDTKDHRSYPTRGWFNSVSLGLNGEWLGGQNNYQTLKYEFKHYIPWGEHGVVAARISGINSYGDIPFWALPSMGSNLDLRGYERGKYRGRHLVAIQAEYRWGFWKKRWGFATFAGAGRLYGESGDNDLFTYQVLQSLGAGIDSWQVRRKD